MRFCVIVPVFMHKLSLFVLMIAVLCLSACAGQKIVELQRKKNTTVILVAKSGAVRVNHKDVQLHGLVDTLKSMGVTKDTRLAVEGEPGADQKEIEQVLETLVDGGLLPKGTID